MGVIEPLPHDQLEATMTDLADWSVVEGKLHVEYQFANFVDAFSFMTKVAIAAEGMNHHPEWCNVYNRVVIDLVTHEAGDQISASDVELARKISDLRE